MKGHKVIKCSAWNNNYTVYTVLSCPVRLITQDESRDLLTVNLLRSVRKWFRRQCCPWNTLSTVACWSLSEFYSHVHTRGQGAVFAAETSATTTININSQQNHIDNGSYRTFDKFWNSTSKLRRFSAVADLSSFDFAWEFWQHTTTSTCGDKTCVM